MPKEATQPINKVTISPYMRQWDRITSVEGQLYVPEQFDLFVSENVTNKEYIQLKINFLIAGMVSICDTTLQIARTKKLRKLQCRMNERFEEDEVIEVGADLEYPTCPFSNDLIQDPICNTTCNHMLDKSSLFSGMFRPTNETLKEAEVCASNYLSRVTATHYQCPSCRQACLISSLARDIETSEKIAAWKSQNEYSKEHLQAVKRKTGHDIIVIE